MSTDITESAIVARCSCGTVRLSATGRPIITVSCYCQDCRSGSRNIEALPNAPQVQDPYGGTEYVLYRQDRVKTLDGSDYLRHMMLEETSKTSRVIATCCNSAMFMHFNDGRHWTPIYRNLFSVPPPLDARICTKSAPAALPAGTPSSSGIPLRMIGRLVFSMVPWWGKS